jgi:predicted nuclease of predicted toxin-antitoxin system
VLFLVDAQLPPALAAALRDAGYEALHVGELDLLGATDRRIWDEAVSRSAVLVTKDSDFATLRVARDFGPTILWVRIGNTNNRTLIAQMLQALRAFAAAIERRDPVIEFVAH